MDTKALRQKILDLAIRGKLVPQDPNDEPASVLLERIRAEKQQMVKDGKLKPKDIKNDTVIFKGDDNLHYEKFSDGTVKCIEDEIPFDVPDGWCWTRIQNIAQFQGGFAYKSSKYVEKSNNIIIRIGNVKNNELNPQISTKYISNEYASETSSYKIRSNDILFTMTGTRGKRDYFYSCLVSLKELKDTCLYLNQRVGCLRIFDIDYIFPKFFLITLQSRFVLDAIFKTETGNVSQGNIGSTATLNLLVPILPVNEQKRIIGKINLLFALVKNIEKNKLSLIDDVSSAKTKILDLAIRGKLVPQDPNDEPASVLLERIRAEKEELIKQGKIKRDKKESVIFKGDDNSYYEKIGNDITCIDDEIPFDIPDTWSWTRISTIADITMGSSPKSQDICNDNHYIEFHQGKIYFSKMTLMKSNQYTRKTTKLAPKQSVLLCVRAPVGELNITDRDICIGRGLASIKSLGNINEEFIFYWLHPYKTYLINQSTGSTFSAITSDTVRNILIPLPPLMEQKEILNKIQKVFTLLEDLETVN